MTNARPGTAGATRTCPHCRETILASATTCPACRHKLRFSDPVDAVDAVAPGPASVPLRVEGSFRAPVDSDAWEYAMVLTIRNQRGEEIARKLVGVGAMSPDDQRTFTLSVELSPASTGGKRTRH